MDEPGECLKRHVFTWLGMGINSLVGILTNLVDQLDPTVAMDAMAMTAIGQAFDQVSEELLYALDWRRELLCEGTSQLPSLGGGVRGLELLKSFGVTFGSSNPSSHLHELCCCLGHHFGHTCSLPGCFMGIARMQDRLRILVLVSMPRSGRPPGLGSWTRWPRPRRGASAPPCRRRCSSPRSPPRRGPSESRRSRVGESKSRRVESGSGLDLAGAAAHPGVRQSHGGGRGRQRRGLNTWDLGIGCQKSLRPDLRGVARGLAQSDDPRGGSIPRALQRPREPRKAGWHGWRGGLPSPGRATLGKCIFA